MSNFSVGDRILLEEAHEDGRSIFFMEAIVCRVYPLGDRYLFYIPDFKYGHNGGVVDWSKNDLLQELIPDKLLFHGNCWNIQEKNIRSFKRLDNVATRSKYWKIIRKIKQIDTKRKELGYDY